MNDDNQEVTSVRDSVLRSPEKHPPSFKVWKGEKKGFQDNWLIVLRKIEDRYSSVILVNLIILFIKFTIRSKWLYSITIIMNKKEYQ